MGSGTLAFGRLFSSGLSQGLCLQRSLQKGFMHVKTRPRWQTGHENFDCTLIAPSLRPHLVEALTGRFEEVEA